ncbi:MAG: ParB/RepB/Spo0J family partition protein [Gemmatimonadota bacterium]|nr:ParB/RepB/Spo0J family partition protein [Gemmatimonadota bacterium]
MANSEKPSRLGRGLDALLARREAPKRDENVDRSQPNDQRNVGSQSARAADSTTERGADRQQTPDIHAKAGPADVTTTERTQAPLRMLAINSIAANPFQPRKEFRPEDLADLEASLRVSGLLQPITVRPSPHNNGYELIAGERRLRAATRLSWSEIPALVRETDDRTMLTLAMVENLQRADLDPIEEADGYQRLIDEFNLTQQEVADVVGKDRSTVANALRLLALPASVRRMLQEREITVGHARALLPLAAERAIAELAREIVAKTLSVRDVEERVRAARPSPAKSGRKPKAPDTNNAPGAAHTAETRRVEEMLRRKLQTTVSLHLNGKDRGELRIAFFSNDDLDRVLLLLGIDLDH